MFPSARSNQQHPHHSVSPVFHICPFGVAVSIIPWADG
ncbi:hypothetical protein SXCC_01001 [Gluconacetobacter sp. SXCC-1]|nr:hypothetical protein SXCC_01001 [Gluconacetobacter sp. SXCC-1]